MSLSHIPVMANELLSLFEDKKLRVFLDGTLGAGGHANILLQAHPEIEKYIGLDRDVSALKIAQTTLKNWEGKVRFMHTTFDQIPRVLERENVSCVDGILLDVGISSMQIDQAERGFSFQREALLDMRMDPTQGVSAKEVINKFTEQKIGQILKELGEEPKWRKIAKAIVEARRKKEIQTTTQLVEIIESVRPRFGKLHPATLTFQALRIYVNDELHLLEKATQEGLKSLCPNGTMVIMSFHRLEDRIVKQAFQQAARSKTQKYHLAYKKPLIPTREEVRKNPRSRSTKFRAIYRGGENE